MKNRVGFRPDGTDHRDLRGQDRNPSTLPIFRDCTVRILGRAEKMTFAFVYDEPERYGFETIGEVDWKPEESYHFDMSVVWIETSTGKIFVGTDSGCSCPRPFEDTESIEDLTEITRPMDLIKYLADVQREKEADQATGAIGELILKVMERMGKRS